MPLSESSVSKHREYREQDTCRQIWVSIKKPPGPSLHSKLAISKRKFQPDDENTERYPSLEDDHKCQPCKPELPELLVGLILLLRPRCGEVSRISYLSSVLVLSYPLSPPTCRCLGGRCWWSQRQGWLLCPGRRCWSRREWSWHSPPGFLTKWSIVMKYPTKCSYLSDCSKWCRPAWVWSHWWRQWERRWWWRLSWPVPPWCRARYQHCSLSSLSASGNVSTSSWHPTWSLKIK